MTLNTTTVGRRLASIEAGTGPGLLMLHGNGGSTLRYRLCLPRLAQNLRAVAIDMPGFGDSRHLPGESYSLEQFSQSVVAFAESHFGQPPVLLGHGVGGVVAVDAVLTHPQNFAGLLLHAPAGARPDRRQLALVSSNPLAHELVRQLIAAPGLRRLWARRFFAQPERLPAGLLNEFFDEYQRCRAFSQFYRLVNPRWFDSIRQSHVPTALLWGARDRLLHVDQFHDWVRVLAPVQARVIPEWDHFPMLETPTEYAAVITELVLGLLARP